MAQSVQTAFREAADRISIKLDAYQDDQKSPPLLSELGVIATAINRALNDSAIPFIEQSNGGKYLLHRASNEPNLVQASITSAQNGSVIFEVFVAATDYVKANDTSIITGLIASMAWDGVKVIGKHLSRAASRLGGSVTSHKISRGDDRKDPYLDNESPKEFLREDPIIQQLSDFEFERNAQPVAIRTVEVTISVREVIHLVRIEYDANKDFSSHRP